MTVGWYLDFGKDRAWRALYAGHKATCSIFALYACDCGRQA